MRLTSVLQIPVILIASGIALSPVQAEIRTWTDKQGRKLPAEFIRLEGDIITLSTKDGAQHRFPLSNLSDTDQHLARSLRPKKVETVAGKDVTAAAAQIDRLVEIDLERNKLKRNELTTDEQFVRRIYLDITGTIPNYEQTVSFIRDRDPDKRSKLINKLMDSDGYVSHMFNYFADMLRLTQTLDQQVGAAPYIAWVKNNIRDDRPYNLMVKDMLTASGKLWDNPAAGYLLRDSGMPLDNLAITTSIFLGTDVACAQCHDHPFDDWTQMNFYEMAAFFGATTTRVNADTGKIKKDAEDLLTKAGYRYRTKEEDENNTRIPKNLRDVMDDIDDLLDANRFAVANVNNNGLRLPPDYKYEDASPNSPVMPKFVVWPDAGENLPIYNVKLDKAESLRDKFATWTTDPQNPRFALTIANRMWKRAFGKGVAEPVDGIKTPEDSSNPQLILHLANEMRRLNFSLKEFMRIVYHTRSYQSQATRETPEMGAPYHFPGPVLRRMTAEQAWDSFMTLIVGDVDQFKGDTGVYASRAMDLNLANTSAQVVLQKLAARGRNLGEMERNAAMQEMAAKPDNQSMIQTKMGGMEDEKMSADQMMRGPMRAQNLVFMRASELEQPARDSHFLRQFGQSDRLVTDSGSTDGSVPQVLMMMNGPAQTVLTGKDSLIFTTMNKEPDPSDKINSVFYSILNRKPTFREMDIVKREFASSGESAIGNIIWALVNTREFMFIQ